MQTGTNERDMKVFGRPSEPYEQTRSYRIRRRQKQTKQNTKKTKKKQRRNRSNHALLATLSVTHFSRSFHQYAMAVYFLLFISTSFSRSQFSSSLLCSSLSISSSYPNLQHDGRRCVRAFFMSSTSGWLILQ